MASFDHSYDTVNIDLSPYVKNLSEYMRDVYLKKLRFEENGSVFYFPDPYALTKDNWCNDSSTWPKLEYPDIVNYLVNSKGEYNSECLKNYKSLTAYEYVISGKVSTVYVYRPSGPLRCFRILGADVQPSQKLREVVLKPWVIVKEGGSVETAHCTCMAGFGETCSHVAALLFKVELGVRSGLTTPGTTEELCRWNSFSNSGLSLPISEIDLRKRKWDTRKQPRKINVMPRKKVSPLTDLDISKIRRAQPNAVFFTSFVSDSSETDSASDNEEVLPPTLVELFKTFEIKDRDGIKSHYNVHNLKSLEEATQGQGSLWLDHRVGRLTSSNFGVVLKRKKKWTEEFSNYILFPRILNVASVKWGKSKEEVAVACYVESAQQNHVDFVYKPAGLCIAPNDPHLGASPDGKINCRCCGEGVLEVKCPFKHKESDPKLISSLDKAFCLNETNELKDTHKYYYQVQGQMAICNVSYCDFVVWTTKGILINRVYRDNEFMSDNKELLNQIYDKMCLPFLIKNFKK